MKLSVIWKGHKVYILAAIPLYPVLAILMYGYFIPFDISITLSRILSGLRGRSFCHRFHGGICSLCRWRSFCVFLQKLVRQKFSSLQHWSCFCLFGVWVFLEWIYPQSESMYWRSTSITNKQTFFCELCRLSVEAHKHEI